MNKTLAITTIALIAVVMVMGAVAPAMADPPAKSVGQWKPCHTTGKVRGETCVTGQPDICPTPRGSHGPGQVWYNDLNNNNVQDGKGEFSQCFAASDNPNAPVRR
jgi:hypothetical protein